MKLLTSTPKFAIYDDVLTKEQFAATWAFMQAEEYKPVSDTHWMKVWRLGDGTPFVGEKDYRYKSKPFGNCIDFVLYYIVELAKKHPELVGVENVDWTEVIVRPYLYARNCKISWHNDAGHVAAAILYTHPHWGSTWGGELFIAETPACDMPNVMPTLEHQWEDEFLGAYGMGNYINPKPNRMVFSKAGVWHQINRVDPDAGDHSRASIVAFFRKE